MVSWVGKENEKLKMSRVELGRGMDVMGVDMAVLYIHFSRA